MVARSIKDVLIKFIISVVFGLNGPLSRRQSLVNGRTLLGIMASRYQALFAMIGSMNLHEGNAAFTQHELLCGRLLRGEPDFLGPIARQRPLASATSRQLQLEVGLSTSFYLEVLLWKKK